MLISKSKRRVLRMPRLIGLGFGLMPIAAFGHHAMDGAMPTTFVAGLLSGLGHPIIGLDHFLFLVALGALCWGARIGMGAISSFVCASLLGVALHVAAVGVPGNESLVALSLLVAGIALWSGRNWSRAKLSIPAAIAGIFHGYAYGESIVGAETRVLLSYLFGVAIVQFLIGTAAYWTARTTAHRYVFGQSHSSWIGALTSFLGAGFFLLSLA